MADNTGLLAQSTSLLRVQCNRGFVNFLHSNSRIALICSVVLQENNISPASFVFNFSTSSCLHSSPALLFFCNLRLGAVMLCHPLFKKCAICMALLLFSMSYPQLPKLLQKLNYRGDFLCSWNDFRFLNLCTSVEDYFITCQFRCQQSFGNETP